MFFSYTPWKHISMYSGVPHLVLVSISVVTLNWEGAGGCSLQNLSISNSKEKSTHRGDRAPITRLVSPETDTDGGKCFFTTPSHLWVCMCWKRSKHRARNNYFQLWKICEMFFHVPYHSADLQFHWSCCEYIFLISLWCLVI